MLNRNYGDTDFITGLRAIAVMFVFLIHSGGGGLRELGPCGNFIVDCGKLGVQIFFVISGFTIFSQFFREKYTFKKFILVRLSRISLPYYPLLLILFTFNILGGHQFNGWAIQLNNGEIDMWNLLAHITYLSTYNLQWQNTIIGVEWTLGIEVFFYFVFGFLIAKRVVKSSWRSLLLFGVGCFFITYGITFLDRLHIVDSLFLSWLPFRYFFMFFLGGMSFFTREWLQKFENHRDDISRHISDITFAIIVIIFLFLIIFSSFRRPPEFLVEWFFVFSTFSVIVTNCKNGKLSSILSLTPLVFLGSISFSFWLCCMNNKEAKRCRILG